jgi:hypothetical protein
LSLSRASAALVKTLDSMVFKLPMSDPITTASHAHAPQRRVAPQIVRPARLAES